MTTQRLDRIALIAMILYILGALSYYLPFFLGSFAPQAVPFRLFFLLPPVFTGAGVYAILQYQSESGFAPRWLAAAALGSGTATLLAWESYLFALRQYNRAHPPTDFSGPDLGPEFLLVIPYGILCAILSIVAALALPKLIRLLLGDLRGPIQSV